MAVYRLMEILLVMMEMTLLPVLIASQCHFPEHWRGIWYQASLGDVIIHESIISDKGACKEKHNDYYIMEKTSPETGRKCKMCMLIIYRHANIIQYRQSYCLDNIDRADKCRWKLPVEKPLHTLVKANGHPVDCPLTEAYKFKYKNNTQTFCQKPESHIKPCARSSKFDFRFRRCRGQDGTQDKDLEFQCLATWKDGNDRLLYGGFSGPGMVNNEDIYRCFKYESVTSTEISIAMSADASCQGLTSAEDGPIVMSLTRDADRWDLARCELPDWLRHREWRDLTGRHLYDADSTGKTWQIYFRHHEKGRGHVTSALRCNKIIQGDSGEFVAVSFSSTNCESYYQCIRIKRIKDNVIEFSQGERNTYQIDFCDSENGYTEKTILFHETGDKTDCPFHGRLEAANSPADMTSCLPTVQNGCNGSHVMQIQSQCVEQTNNARLECLSDWKYEGKHYVIARELRGYGQERDDHAVANCLTFSYEGANLRVETDSDCNQGARHITGKSIHLLVDGHTSPCQAEESLEITPTSSDVSHNVPSLHCLILHHVIITFLWKLANIHQDH